MNYCAKNYAEAHNQVCLKFRFLDPFDFKWPNCETLCTKNHKLRLFESELALEQLREEHGYTRSKLETMEDNLPKIIREMIDYHKDTNLAPRLDCLVKKKKPLWRLLFAFKIRGYSSDSDMSIPALSMFMFQYIIERLSILVMIVLGESILSLALGNIILPTGDFK